MGVSLRTLSSKDLKAEMEGAGDAEVWGKSVPGVRSTMQREHARHVPGKVKRPLKVEQSEQDVTF